MKHKTTLPPHSIRIIAGKHRGRKLTVLSRDGLRPTPNRVRETIFNWLQFELAGAYVLDAFAGTGAMGLEALSRGAESVLFCDTDTQATNEIRQTIEAWRESHARVIKTDIMQLQQSAVRYDFIFIDPPFALDYYQAAVDKFATEQWIKPHGKLILEMPINHPPLELPEGFHWQKQSQAGQVRFGLIAREDT